MSLLLLKELIIIFYLKKSHFAQRYIETGLKQGRNLTLQMPIFEFEFQEDLDLLKDKEGNR